MHGGRKISLASASYNPLDHVDQRSTPPTSLKFRRDRETSQLNHVIELLTERFLREILTSFSKFSPSLRDRAWSNDRHT